ncbi:hypothetical protein LCGC14_2115970, partial [marine sediment metagenome]
KTERRFRSLIEQTTDAVFCYEYNPSIPINLPLEDQVKRLYDGVLVDCNLICARAYGADRIEDVIGRKLTDLFGTIPKSLDKLFRDMIEGGYSIVDGVGIEKLPNGEERYFLNNGHSVIENHKLVRVWGTFRDITDRKKNEKKFKESEKKLKESEEKFRNITEQSLMGICIAQDNQFKYINKAYADIFGYTDEEMMKWGIQDAIKAIYPDDREFAIEQLTKKQKGEKDAVTHYQYRGVKKSGEIIWVDQFSKTIIFEGKPADFIMLIDITQRKNVEKKLHDERDLIYALLDNHPDFIYFKDNRARFQHISKRFCDFFGRRMEDIIGKTDLELFPEEIAMQTHSEDLNIIRTGIPIINKEENSGDTWVLTTKMPWFDKEGNIKGLFGISRDITDLKEAERNIKESEVKFRGIMNSIPDQVCILDRSLDILYINSVTEEIYGPSALGSKCYQIYHGLDEPCSDCQVRRTFEDSEVHNKECIRRMGEESRYCWCVSNVFERDEEERPISVVEVSRDITDRKKIEQELKVSEEKYRLLFDNSPIGIGLSTIEGKVLDSNDAMVELTGFSVEDLNKVGAPSIYVDPKERSRILKVLHEEGKLHDYEIKLRRIDNSEFFGSISFDLIELGGKKIIQTSLTDITKSKTAESELIKLNNLKSELLRRTSHELKTPLVSIKG